MSKHRTHGQSVLNRIRAVVAFRHENRAARFLSTLLAFAIASLLVVGSGAAYGDDSASTDPAAPQASAPADPTSSDSTPTPADPSPSQDATTTPSGGSAPESTSGTSSSAPTGTAKPKSVRTNAITTALSSFAAGPVPNLVGNAACQAGGNTLVGGFEIDGDPCDDEGGIDFLNGPGAQVDDGFQDSSWFTQGSAERDVPSSWTFTGSGNTGKADIGTAWAWSQSSNGHVYAYFGFTNNSTAGGTQNYSLEFNQANPSGGAPVRTPGDLLFRFAGNGNAPLAYQESFIYTLKASVTNAVWNTCQAITGAAPAGGWCPKTLPNGAWMSKSSTSGEYGEASIDISAMFGAGTCSGTFGTTFLRSDPGSFWTSEMKDYVAPLGVTTPSTCGKLIINKTDVDKGGAVAGAVFAITGDPRPGGNDSDTYCVFDGTQADMPAKPAGCDFYVADGTADGTITIDSVEPGTYTVTEIVAPPGYMLNPEPNPGNSMSVTVGESQTKTLTFSNHAIWKGLTASKTASTSYRADYAWSIDKEISADGSTGWTSATTNAAPLLKKVAAGSLDTLFYRVTVTEGARTTSQYKVVGTVTVNNPADNVGSMDAVVTDTLPGASCLVDGGASKAITVAKGGSVDVPYVCTFAGTPTAGQLAGTNTAKVEWDRSDYPQVLADLSDPGTRKVEPTASYDFANASVTEINKTVTVTDDQHTFVPAWTITWNSADGATNTSAVYSQTVTAAPGSCSAVFANTATITGDNQVVLGSDSAYGKVCEGADLTITRMDARAFTRTYPWSIEKATTTPKITVTGGKATASYDVTVTAGDGVDGPTWSMTGTITVHNPNDWESVAVTSLPVTYSGGGTCAVTGESFPVSIAAGGQHAFAYSCDFGGVKPSYSGDITATATWDASAATTPNDHVSDALWITEADWTKTLVNESVTVVDDHATPGDTSDDTQWTLDWSTVYALSGHQKVLHYTTDLAVPDGGTCAVRTNTVKILGDGDTVLDADGNQENNSAAVQVCNPLGLSVTKTAVGDYTRTYPWALEKFIDTDHKSQTVHIDGYDYTFDYKVKATPGAAVDSGWKVSGTIKVHNDNTDDAISPITVNGLSDSPDVGAASSCIFDKGLPFDVASGEDVYVNYVCTLAQKPSDNSGGELPTYGGTNSASVQWGASGSATTPAVSVDWQNPTEVDKTLPIYDDKTDPPTGVLIGTAVWNAAHTPTVVDYSKNLTVPQSTAGSCAPPQTNTAWLGGTAAAPSDLQDSVDAIICVNAGTWSVSKVNVNGDGPVPTDSDVTYRLTAHKTGGVNPKNVVLHDDLSDIAPYITGAPSYSAPAGTTVDYDAATHVLTWTIAELGDADRTLDFTVHVKADAYGVDLPNLVTSPGSDNCPDAETAGAECRTDNDTPHYTLEKSSDAGATVMPPYLGAQGTLITYTLTVHNDSDAPINGTTMPGETVTDDLSDVLDNATWVGNITPSGQAERAGNTLTWTLPVIPAGGTATLSYQVRVAGDQWDETLRNVATPGNGGDCLTPEVVLELVALNGSCTTTTVTPPYALIQALKVDSETGEPLQGAEFTLAHDGTALDTATSDADGVVTFTTKLQPGTFTVTETKAPAGYQLPASGASQDVTVTADQLDDGVEPVQVTFADPPTGALAIAKAHQELASGSWVPGDGTISFNDQVKYVLTVAATGTRVFHQVTVTDYVPGYNPADSKTSLGGFKAVLDTGSLGCSGGFTCTTSYDAATGLITWHLTGAGQAPGDLRNQSGTLQFVVRMPDLPRVSPLAAPGVSFAGLMWNQATLGWDQSDESHHSVLSNEVTDAASEVLPPKQIVSPPKQHHPAVLPNTGGPDRWLLAAGLLLLLGGGTLVAGDRRKKRRS